MGGKRSAPEGGKKKQPVAKKKKTSVSTDVTEEAFPRGGKGVLSSIEVKKIHEEVKHDLFRNPNPSTPQKEENNNSNKRKKTPKRRSKKQQNQKMEEEEEINDDSFEGIIKRLDRDAPTYAENLSQNVCMIKQKLKKVDQM